MTAGELEKKFESEFAASITDGMMWGGAFPKEKIDAVTYSVEPEVKIDPAHHQLIIWRPLIMDHRTLPKTFLGFKVDWLVRNDSIPEELRADEEGLMHYDECWSEERVIAYVREHAIDICEKLNDYTLTEKELCDIIAGGDFERLKKDVAEERAARLNGEYDDFEDFDEDDFDDIDEEPPR